MKKQILFALLATMMLCHYQRATAFLIVGTRSRSIKEGYLQSKCLICGQEKCTTLKAYSVRHWLTLFFIPVAPYGKKKYYLKCPQCKNFYRLIDKMNLDEIMHKEKCDEMEHIS